MFEPSPESAFTINGLEPPEGALESLTQGVRLLLAAADRRSNGTPLPVEKISVVGATIYGNGQIVLQLRYDG